MKLLELHRSTPNGTYAGARFSAASREAINDYMTKNQIPNPSDTDDLHSTLLFSRKYLPEYVAKGPYDPTIKAQPAGFEVWPTQSKEKSCLVMRLDAPDFVKRHESLMDAHDATYDFDEFKPHVTLSYDVGDLDPNKLPSFEDELEMTEEYAEDLSL